MTDTIVEITKLSKIGGNLSKVISLSADGHIVSDGSACVMSQGTAHRTKFTDLRYFAQLIDGLASNEAISLGALRRELPDEVRVVTKGTGLAIVVNDTNITTNGAAGFSDDDLCGIFSGRITNFTQITDSPTAPAAGAFKLLYRSDTAGNTFTLTNHLAAVCTAGNTQAGVTFTPTSSFTALFPGGITNTIPNAVGVSGLAVLANTLAGLVSGPVPQAISYISPDWTSVDSATSSAKLSNGQPSPLIVAELKNANRFYLPTGTNIALALSHPTTGANLTPPSTATQGANGALWVPIIQKASTGYPVVSYSEIEMTQCYGKTAVTSGMTGFLKDHYGNASYTAIQENNGLVPVANSGAAKFLAAIRKNILTNANGWNTNIGNATACAGKVGR
jgi:phosphate transport system substrate-binding protein